MSLLSSRKEQKRFIKFSIVGATGTIVDFSTFNLCFAVIGLTPEVSQAISFTAAVTSNFILNYIWTFRDSRSKKLHVQVGQYLLVNVVGLIIRTPIFSALSGVLEPLLGGVDLPFSPDPYWLAHNLALAGAIGVVLLWNYFVNRKWTFGDVDAA